ncbi:DVL [Macleaya cordata]|uniref:DVL n=1 Tax=Macleaya cordata TaxID=56857 RepID=A0A200QZU0_MACCD|nr:DVL [Macleaya cordata]
MGCTGSSSRSKNRGSRNWEDEDERGGGEGSQRRGCFVISRERRSRFYIVRRCIMMLLCWHKYGKY